MAFRDIYKVSVEPECNKLLLDAPGVIGAGGNSGFQALNIAVQFGAKRIILVGFDMHDVGGVHWHGNHANGLNNPRQANFMRWRRALENAAPTLIEARVDVVNASQESALTIFSKMTITEAMERWRL